MQDLINFFKNDLFGFFTKEWRWFHQNYANLRFLFKHKKRDCWGQVLWAYLWNPKQFEVLVQNEKVFQAQLENGFKKVADPTNWWEVWLDRMRRR